LLLFPGDDDEEEEEEQGYKSVQDNDSAVV
jgi:hypothetical protein